MKKITRTLFSILTLSLAVACIDTDNDELTKDAETGGLINVNTLLVPYVVGNKGPYSASLSLYQGKAKVSSIDVYKKFVSKDKDESNTILFKTINITNLEEGTISSETFDLNYDELIDGLMFNGNPLPSDDTGLAIGDSFVLTYKSNLSTNEVRSFPNTASFSTKIAVGTRLAGTYTIQQGWYIHPSTAPNLAGDYSGAYNRIIESVALVPEYTVYKSTTMGWGPAGNWDDPADMNFFYFYVNNTAESDGSYKITIPNIYDNDPQLLWTTDPIAECINTVANLPDVSCTNSVVLDNINGEDVINISYGYTRSSGTRQFDEILIKQ